jgi:hypothetical protein
METVLVAMYRMLDDQPLYTLIVYPDAPEFEGIYNTTWTDLEDRLFLQGFHGLNFSHYQLTGYGWLGAITVTGEIETPEFKEKLGRLSSALKAKVKGRGADALTNEQGLAAETGLPEGWIYNVVESEIWKYHLNRVGPKMDDSKTCIWVPIDFGMEPL